MYYGLQFGKIKMFNNLKKQEFRNLADVFGDLDSTHEQIADAGRDLILRRLVALIKTLKYEINMKS